jgi:hypothetical protein
MSQDDVLLRKSLDAVDRHKWRSLGVIVFAIVSTAAAFLRLNAAFQSG